MSGVAKSGIRKGLYLGPNYFESLLLTSLWGTPTQD